MNYDLLKQATGRGWNTWNTTSILSFVHLPEGFAIHLVLRDPGEGRVLREPLIGRFGDRDETVIPGARTYDGRYTEMTLRYAETEFRVQSAVREDEQILYIEPVKQGFRPAVLGVEACLLWGREGSVEKKGGRLLGHFGSRTFEVFSSAPTVAPVYTYSLSPSFAVVLSEPVVISTRPMTVDEARAILAENKAALDAENRAYGDRSEAHTAMKTCLAWDTVYEPEHDRVCSTVSRLWNINFGGYVLFDWDTYFAALMASIDHKELAFLNAIAITDEATERGFVPNFGCACNTKSRDRSQPPVGSPICLDIYRRWPEKWFLERVFPTLLTWNRWFSENRTTAEGYMCWGSDPYDPVTGSVWEKNVGNRFCSALESGLDNAPMYDGQGYDEATHRMQLADVGLMGLYIADCEALAEIAAILGRREELSGILARRDRVEAALATLWDDGFGLFCNKDLRDGSLSHRISPTNFYALASRKVTEAQKRRMMDEHFYNPEEFWGDWVLPTAPRNDPAYPDQTYWRGRIWAPTNYLVYRALKQAGLKKECHDLAEKSERLILQEWRLHGHVHENYSGDDGMGCGVVNSDRFYHWGGLLAYIALDDSDLGRA